MKDQAVIRVWVGFGDFFVGSALLFAANVSLRERGGGSEVGLSVLGK